MEVAKYKDLSSIFSPYTYLVLMWFSYFLTYIENGFGWGGKFDYYAPDYLHYFVIFTIVFILGGIFSTSLSIKNSSYYNEPSIHIVWKFFLIAVIFHVAKFINIGDIPLLGDPMSRYNLTLGGYEDYPSRLLAPIGIVFFILYMDGKRFNYLAYTFICTLLPLLLMQRQEVLILVLGCIMTYLNYKKVSLSNAIFVVFFTSLVLVFGIAMMTIARYGAENLSDGMSIIEIIFWIFHGELTTPIKLGAYADELTPNLNGLYTFGSFLSIVIPGFSAHGAELIRTMFTDADTAQSVGSLFGFAIDFGPIGVGVIGFFTSFISFLFYKKWKESNNLFFAVIYPIIFLQLLWNLRSGNFLLNPLIIYIILAVYFIANPLSNEPLDKFVKVIFLLTLPLSFVGLLVRI